MALSNQMEMFEDGGLKDEGGMTDEVSGNDVPSGSTREEVRDDIPAQLSEGEFVFPADVVRFLGLEKLMQMRQKAKMGLQKMESMGQMGNSDEATMPDDMPFDLNDLDMQEDVDNEEDVEYNKGGVVKAAVGAYVPPALPTSSPYDPTKNVYTGQTNAPVTPYMPKATNILGASDPSKLVGGVPVAEADSDMFEQRRYVNEATGAVRFVSFNKATGQSTTNVKQLLDQGFVRKDEAIKEATKTATPTSTNRRPQEQDNGGDSEPMGSSTKDQSFTDINVSTLKSEELKEALSSVSIMSQFGQFAPALGLRDAVTGRNATARNMGAAIGGMLDNFRGGTVEFTSKGMNTNYNDTRSLNDLNKFEQARLGKVAAATVKAAEVIFFDIDPITKEKTARQRVDAIARLDKYAKEFGIKKGKKSITQYTREITKALARSIEIKQQDVVLDNIYKDPTGVIMGGDKTYSKEQVQDSYDPSTDYSSGDSGPPSDGGFSQGQSFSYEDSSGDTQSGVDTSGYTDTSTGLGVGAKGGFFTKSKMTKQKPKKMKRGGLASR